MDRLPNHRGFGCGLVFQMPQIASIVVYLSTLGAVGIEWRIVLISITENNEYPQSEMTTEEM